MTWEGPSFVSLFTGAGGLDIGLERAGLDAVALSDIDVNCVETLRANQERALPVPGRQHAYLEGARIVHQPIEVTNRDDVVPDGAGPEWHPTALVGGPPCQPFSSAGKMRSVDDPRGRLFEHFVRLAKELRPRFILFENVRGMVTSRGPGGVPGETINLVRRSFERIGYATTFALLNAADYGAPQRRVRCFMLAARVPPLPSFPEPTHARDPEQFPDQERKPWVTLAEFLESCPEPDREDVVRPTASLAKQLQSLPLGSGLKSPGAKETTRPGGHWGYRQGTFVADPSLPARTVTGATGQDWLRLPDGSLRRLTWRECAGLQGFPSTWQFVGSKANKFLQIGNAVPTVFGEVLGEALLDALAQNPNGSGPRPNSAPFPASFENAIAYTKREQARNGDSRERAKLAGRTAKGTGSAGG